VELDKIPCGSPAGTTYDAVVAQLLVPNNDPEIPPELLLSCSDPVSIILLVTVKLEILPVSV
jgi:hypothetical protein